jgi:hypothetical protein
MACSTTADLKNQAAIPFTNIKTAYGVRDVVNFKTTGKFVCEKQGLYLISAQIMSTTKGAEFGIIQNGQELALVQIVPFHDSDTHNYHTGTGLAVAHLNQNDQIWIEVRHYDMHIFGQESCLNIIKVR